MKALSLRKLVRVKCTGFRKPSDHKKDPRTWAFRRTRPGIPDRILLSRKARNIGRGLPAARRRRLPPWSRVPHRRNELSAATQVRGGQRALCTSWGFPVWSLIYEGLTETFLQHATQSSSSLRSPRHVAHNAVALRQCHHPVANLPSQTCVIVPQSGQQSERSKCTMVGTSPSPVDASSRAYQLRAANRILCVQLCWIFRSLNASARIKGHAQRDPGCSLCSLDVVHVPVVYGGHMMIVPSYRDGVPACVSDHSAVGDTASPAKHAYPS